MLAFTNIYFFKAFQHIAALYYSHTLPGNIIKHQAKPSLLPVIHQVIQRLSDWSFCLL